MVNKFDSNGNSCSSIKEINKDFKMIKMDSSKTKHNNKKFTIIFFHGKNHASLQYNYTYEDGKVRKNYFLDKLSGIANLFMYDRPEEMLRFNYESGKYNCNVELYF